jgi:hypothetical protein
MKVFEIGCQQGKVAGEWMSQQSGDRSGFYSTPGNILVIKQERIRWAGM